MDGPPPPSPPCSPGANCYYPPLHFYEGLIFLTPILFTIIMIMVLCSVYFRRQRDRGLVARSLRSVSTRNFFATPLPCGLDKMVRESFTTFTYVDKSSLQIIKGDEQCAVCLGDYQRNEKLKQLPGCLHAFHSACIDLWLESNTTCPLCRVSLLPQPPLPFNTASPSDAPVTVLTTPQSTESSTGSSSLQTAALLANTSVEENREHPLNIELVSHSPPSLDSPSDDSTSTSQSVVVDLPASTHTSPSANGKTPVPRFAPTSAGATPAASHPEGLSLGQAPGSSSRRSHSPVDIETGPAPPSF